MNALIGFLVIFGSLLGFTALGFVAILIYGAAHLTLVDEIAPKELYSKTVEDVRDYVEDSGYGVFIVINLMSGLSVAAVFGFGYMLCSAIGAAIVG